MFCSRARECKAAPQAGRDQGVQSQSGAVDSGTPPPTLSPLCPLSPTPTHSRPSFLHSSLQTTPRPSSKTGQMPTAPASGMQTVRTVTAHGCSGGGIAIDHRLRPPSLVAGLRAPNEPSKSVLLAEGHASFAEINHSTGQTPTHSTSTSRTSGMQTVTAHGCSGGGDRDRLRPPSLVACLGAPNEPSESVLLAEGTEARGGHNLAQRPNLRWVSPCIEASHREGKSTKVE